MMLLPGAIRPILSTTREPAIPDRWGAESTEARADGITTETLDEASRFILGDHQPSHQIP